MTSPSGRGRASAILIIGAAVCFGTTGTAQALGAPAASAVSLGAARIVFGGALLALFALFAARSGARSRPGSTAQLQARTSLLARLHAVRPVEWMLVAVGAVGVAAYQPTFFTGTSQNGVAVGTLVALGSAPVITGLLEWLVRRRAPGMRWALATAIAALGVATLSGAFALLFGSGASTPSTITALGIVASLGAGVSYALYALSSKALLDLGWTPAATMGTTFGAAAVIMTPVLLGSDLAWLATPSGGLTAAWLAVVTTALAYTLFARGLRGVPASQASTLTLVEPLTATVLGLVVLHEQFTVSIAAGLVLLAAGLAVLALSPQPRVRASPSR
ncbi:DMT family transporter [Subtercola sp. PAMC28395]|uniref:EamA family transporter n=1 Tax=Subtercola sp. PAMC28395 TaxID=2846775 RepID=UPI001C0D07E1|nr:EamA family transporter [Subtercola sp. PAMC28395]QWT24265.1 DMT family transporter [Subtercola sp. PAMC28395]